MEKNETISSINADGKKEMATGRARLHKAYSQSETTETAAAMLGNGTSVLETKNKVLNRSASQQTEKKAVCPPNISQLTNKQDLKKIYPNLPYSPYGSPRGSPGIDRRCVSLPESQKGSTEDFLQFNQYKLKDLIGQGSYGLVKLAYSEKDSTHYAMKILSKRRLVRKAGFMGRGPRKTLSPLDRVYREIAVLKKLDHPNVVKLIEVLDDPTEDFLYMVFELVERGPVLQVPTEEPLSEQFAWIVFRDVLMGLEYLHYQHILHGDIKPENLLIAETGRVKIADLGVCNEFFDDDATIDTSSAAGTPAFRAPETLLTGQHFCNGKAVDIWALGATLYSLVYGQVPFTASAIPEVYDKIQNAKFEFPTQPATSSALKDCISRMLDKNPKTRITLPELKEHDWVTNARSSPLITETQNLSLVQVNEEDLHSVVKTIPKLNTLILIKTMLRKHSFGNPFLKGTPTNIKQTPKTSEDHIKSAAGPNSLIQRKLAVATNPHLPSLQESCSKDGR